MFISAIDVQIVGMNLLELNGLDTVMAGGADLQPWEAAHQMLAYHMVLLMGITSTITFQQQGQTKGLLGSLYRHFDTRTVSLQTMDTSPTETIHSNKGIWLNE